MRILKSMLRIILPLACSAALVIWLFSKIDFREMIASLNHVNYWYLSGLAIFVVLSFIVRAIRWGFQLEGVGIEVPFHTLCVSIFGAYGLNLLLYGAGEAWRCIFISRRSGASLTKVIGTDVGDRSSDFVCIVLLILLALVVAKTDIDAFLIKYQVGRDIDSIVEDWRIWIIVVICFTILFWAYHFFSQYKIVKRIHNCLHEIWQGIWVIFTMKHRWAYLWLTIGIWICYYMQNYICFPAFPFMQRLLGEGYAYGLVPALVACVFVSVSMIVPSSGGLGPWNIAMIFALSLYDVPRTEAAAFAMLLWATQALTEALVGIYAMIYVSVTRRKVNTSNPKQKAVPAANEKTPNKV